MSFRFFKIGVVPVKIEYGKYGPVAAYAFDGKDFKIDNTFIAEAMEGEDVEELTEPAFKCLIEEESAS